MIPRAHLIQWRSTAPWATDAQVEQDLVISRAVVELFLDPELREQLAFRGGTALHKLYFQPPERYSEDIDLVQVVPGPIGPVLDRVRGLLDPWLGKPRYKSSMKMATLTYRFQSEDKPPVALRLKIEINTREHFSLDGLREVPFKVDSRWFSGEAMVKTYSLEELLATKVRALYQRRKGRDAFDLDRSLEVLAPGGAAKVIEFFAEYMGREGTPISRAMFIENLAAKRGHPDFLGDTGPLLSAEAPEWVPQAGLDRVEAALLTLIPE